MTQSSDVGSCGGVAAPLSIFSSLTHSSGCSASLTGLGFRRTRARGGVWGVPLVS